MDKVVKCNKNWAIRIDVDSYIHHKMILSLALLPAFDMKYVSMATLIVECWDVDNREKISMKWFRMYKYIS